MSATMIAWIGGAAVVILILGLLDGIRRKQARDARARMTPEERAIAEREEKVFRSAVRRGR